MARKKHEEEHENSERWLVTYADLITLLLAFFIMMYSMSKVDMKKFGAMTAAMNAIFEGGGMQSQGDSGVSLGVEATAIPTESESIAIMREALDGLKHKVLDALAAKELEDIARVGLDPRGVVLTIDNGYLFAPGDAHLRGESRWLLSKIAGVLAAMPVEIRIEGHTDNVPMAGGPYADNWDLSTARATTVLRSFVRDSHVEPARLSASGYGEFRPVATNETAAGRARNRRVELVISPTGMRGPSVTVEEPAVTTATRQHNREQGT
jgi:chemotaxis protein MotB